MLVIHRESIMTSEAPGGCIDHDVRRRGGVVVRDGAGRDGAERSASSVSVLNLSHG